MTYTRDPVTTCTGITVAQGLWHVTPVVRIHVHHFTEYRHVILLWSSLHGFSAYYCYTCMYGFFILVIWIPVHIMSYGFPYITCIIVPCYRIHVIWLFPVIDMDIPDTGHESCWYAICGIPHLLFPFPVILFPVIYCSRFPLYCTMLSTELRSSYHVTRILYCSCSCYIVYLTYQIIKLTWVWGRLDGWLDLIGWMSGSIVCPTAGDGVVLATVCYSWASRYCFGSLRFPLHVTALAGWPWSQQPGVCLRPWSRVCTGCTYPIRTPRPWVSN